MHYLLMFIAGTFLCNTIPHLVSGLRGDLFPSPFASPPGKGNSPPVVNFAWGTTNLVIGGGLVSHAQGSFADLPGLGALLLGWIACGVMLAVHFGKVRKPVA